MGKFSNLKQQLKKLSSKSISRRSKMKIFAAAVLIAVMVVWVMPRISYSISPSLKYSMFYLELHPDVSKVAKGDYVRFVLKHKLLKEPKTNKAIKEVRCVGGDILTVDNDKNYYCNGVLLGKAKDKALSGETLDNFVFYGVIPTGDLFVMGHHKDSLDSRYVGFVQRSAILQVAYPLF